MSRLFHALEPLALLIMAATMIVYTCRESLTETKAIPASAAVPDRVLVIDSGHGGSDGGAVSCRGNPESHINYQISIKTADFAMLYGLEVCCTRETENIAYPAECSTIRQQKKWDTCERVRRIELVPGSVLLSIHQNYYPTEEPCGLQLLTAPTEGSEEFADSLAGELEDIDMRTTSVISKDVYLMNHVTCPAVLCECGFLSNPQEEAKLCDESYQKYLARCLALGAGKILSNYT